MHLGGKAARGRVHHIVDCRIGRPKVTFPLELAPQRVDQRVTMVG
jgi:hypothetical protein